MIGVFLFNTAIMLLAVVTHYELLIRLTRFLQEFKLRHRSRILLGVCVALVAHVVEVWLFAVAYYVMEHFLGWGYLDGVSGHLLEYGYFSFTTYTTLGFGDISPVGEMRYLTGIEALIGLVLVTWTASYLFIEMQRYWNKD